MAPHVIKNPNEVNRTTVLAAVEKIVANPEKLTDDYARSIRRHAFQRAFGSGPERLLQLDDMANVYRRHGHYVRVFRMTAEEMKQELLAKAQREYAEVQKQQQQQKKKGATLKPWDTLVSDVWRKYVVSLSHTERILRGDVDHRYVRCASW